MTEIHRASSLLRAVGTVFLLLGLAGAAGAEDDPLRHPQRMDAAASGAIPAPLSRTRAALLDIARFDRWFPSLGEWRVLERSGDGLRVYGRHALPWPAEDRDYVVDYRWWDDAEGTFVLEATARDDAAPPPPGVIRLDRLRSRWTLRAEGDTTRAHYEVELIPRGELPRWLEQASWRRESWRLIDALAREVARREPR